MAVEYLVQSSVQLNDPTDAGATPVGKFFLLRNPTTGLVLEIKDGVDKPRTHVITAYQREPMELRDRQLWFVDSSTIRNKINFFCLDIENAREVIVNPYQPKNKHQRWTIKNQRIVSREYPDNVLGFECKDERLIPVGAQVFIQDAVKSENQRWTVVHVEPQFFYIRNQGNQRVLETVSTGEDWRCRLSPKKPLLDDAQLWYEDTNGLIRSRVECLYLAAAGNNKNEIILQKTASVFQEWVLEGTLIKNRKCPQEFLDCKTGKYMLICNRTSGLALSVRDESFAENAAIVLREPRRERKESSAQVKRDVMWAPDQAWYLEESTGTLRSALNEYCVDIITENEVVLRPYENGRIHQLWTINSNVIRSRSILKKDVVLEAGHAEKDGAETSSRPGGTCLRPAKYDPTEDAQHWRLVRLEAPCFYIRCMTSDLVVEIRDGVRWAGGAVVLNPKHVTSRGAPSLHQLWYEDEAGVIRNKLNGYIIDLTGPEAQMKPFDRQTEMHYWWVRGFHIRNMADTTLALDTKKGQLQPKVALVAAKVVMERESQKWRLEYIVIGDG